MAPVPGPINNSLPIPRLSVRRGGVRVAGSTPRIRKLPPYPTIHRAPPGKTVPPNHLTNNQAPREQTRQQTPIPSPIGWERARVRVARPPPASPPPIARTALRSKRKQPKAVGAAPPLAIP